MATYPKSAYKNLFASSPGSAKNRGWGNGWPNCQTSKIKTIVAEGGSAGDIRVSVRAEVAPMVRDLLEATDKQYNIKPSSTGAYNCRPIGGTSTASNHSWGLAIDINWNDNPQSSTFKSTIPPKVVEMWQKAGWYWGGFYTRAKPDTMHFEYTGKPSDVAKHAKIAAGYNKGGSTPEPEPTPTPTPSQPSTYTVKAGDSLSEIAAKYKTTVAELVRLNSLANANVIQVGQKLKLPVDNFTISFDERLLPFSRHALVPYLKRYMYLLGRYSEPDGPEYTTWYDQALADAVAAWHQANPKYTSGGYDPQIGPTGWKEVQRQAKAAKG